MVEYKYHKLRILKPSHGGTKILVHSLEESGRGKGTSERNLMYVEAWVNHRAERNTIVDSRATHNLMIKMKQNA